MRYEVPVVEGHGTVPILNGKCFDLEAMTKSENKGCAEIVGN
jgi:hypothetical protein